MVASGPPVVVEAQPRVNMPFGLFSVLNLREASDPHWANGIEWQAVSCSPVTGTATWQDDPDCATDYDKVFRGSGGLGSARPFYTVGSYKCGAPGGPAFEEGEAFATADLLAHEEQQAELIFWKRLAAQATDLNAAGALTPAKALAALEDWIGRAYGSLGVIHASRGSVSVLDTRVNPSGSRLLTKVGTPVVAGGGYLGTGPGGSAPAAGTSWVFASPAMFGYRGQVFTTSALDRTKNDHYAISERAYVVGFDPCGVGAVRMNIE